MDSTFLQKQKSSKKLLSRFALRACFIFCVDCHDLAMQNLAMAIDCDFKCGFLECDS